MKNGQHGPKIVTDGLQLYMDPLNTRCYAGSGTSAVTDLSLNGADGTIQNNGQMTYDNTLNVWNSNGTNASQIDLGFPSNITQVQAPLTIMMIIRHATIAPQYQYVWNAYLAHPPGNPAKIYSVLGYSNYGTYGYAQSLASTTTATLTTKPFTQTAVANKWTFLCAVVNGTISSPVLDMYLKNEDMSNTEERIGTVLPAMMTNVSASVKHTIGSTQSVQNGIGLNGKLGPVLFYNRGLSQTEVTQNLESLGKRFGL